MTLALAGLLNNSWLYLVLEDLAMKNLRVMHLLLEKYSKHLITKCLNKQNTFLNGQCQQPGEIQFRHNNYMIE